MPLITPISLSPSMPLRLAAAAYLDSLAALVRQGRRSPRTLYHRRYGLGFLGRLGEVPVGELRRSEAISWLVEVAALPGTRKEVCASRDHSAIRGLQALVRWCADRDLCRVDVVARVTPEYRSPPSRALSLREYRALRSCLASRGSRADFEALLVIAESGARPQEVRLARRENFDRHDGVLRWDRGKNGRPRVIVLSASSLRVVAPRAERPGLLFPSHVRPSAPYSEQHLGRLLKDVAREADVRDPDGLSVSDLRSTFATLALQLDCSVDHIAEALSHLTPRTTRQYYLHAAVTPGARHCCRVVNEEEIGGAL